MTLKSDTFQILSVLADGDRDSNEILEVIRRRGGGAGPSLPTLYRRLKEALDEGWIASIEAGADEESMGPGRPRQRFRLTELGRERARYEAAVWTRFADPLLGEEAPS